MAVFPIVEARATRGLSIILDGQLLLQVDATVEERHSSSADVTAYPRENLSPGSDHIQPKQPRIQATVIVSKTPLTERGSVRRDVEAYQTLRALQTNRSLVTLVTSLVVYENMALTDLSAPRSATVGQKLLADCTFVPLEVVVTQDAEIPPEVIAALARSSGKGEPETNDQVRDDNGSPARKKTALKALVDGARSLGD